MREGGLQPQALPFLAVTLAPRPPQETWEGMGQGQT